MPELTREKQKTVTLTVNMAGTGARLQHYHNATFTRWEWGIHIVADDQEVMIPWHAIEQIDVMR